ncbi:MAG: excinuclease ABC subunit UvrC [Fibrobacterota bacterium]|nr:excinuclease ABC subunit UvrC [Fibrobacterota bacterium]
MSSELAGALPAALQAKLEDLPTRPGVYLMKSAKGEIVYIGKAINLRNRVRSYFNKQSQSNHLASTLLRAVAKDLEWIITDNEVEALILEANLVNKHGPRYNVQLKDDKHFPYIKVTLSEPYPRLVITRQAGGVKSKDMWFGPYTNVRAMRKTLNLLNKIFRIRDCDLKIPLAQPIRPCLSYHLKRCDAPCANLTTPAAYKHLVDQAVLLLKGRHRDLMQDLDRKMRLAADTDRFEEAARIRDQMRDLEAIKEDQKVDLGSDHVSKDLIAAARVGKLACILILEIRDGYVSGRKHFEVTCPLEQDEASIISEFIKGNYLRQGPESIPRELILSHPTLEEENIQEALRGLRGAAVDIEVPQKGEKRRQVNLAMENAKLLVAEMVARRERKNRQSYRVTALQEDLGLPVAPNRIEGFDISHLSGTDTVASQVVFVDGKPSKKDYRHYNVKTVEGIDDFASMREIVGRRVKRLIDENQPFPDLILIDGGKGQLGMAVEVLRQAGRPEQPIIGLAKRLEEIFLPGRSEPLLIPKTSPSLQLLQQVRDEAHRFAITFQRSKRKKHIETSWLDEVPGVGSMTKMKLLRSFGAPAAIEAATETDLAKAAGKAVASRIRTYLEGKETAKVSAQPSNASSIPPSPLPT